MMNMPALWKGNEARPWRRPLRELLYCHVVGVLGLPLFKIVICIRRGKSSLHLNLDSGKPEYILITTSFVCLFSFFFVLRLFALFLLFCYVLRESRRRPTTTGPTRAERRAMPLTCHADVDVDVGPYLLVGTLRQHLLSSRHADAHIVRFQVHSRDLAVFGDDGAAFASVLTENGGRVKFQVPGFGQLGVWVAQEADAGLCAWIQ